MEEGTFKERYLAGEIPFEEIDRYISRWNNSDDPRTLAQYLGLNAEEEDVWIDESDDALQDMLDGQKGSGNHFTYPLGAADPAAGSGHGLPAFFRPSPCGGEGRRSRPGPEGRKGSVWMIQGQRR